MWLGLAQGFLPIGGGGGGGITFGLRNGLSISGGYGELGGGALIHDTELPIAGLNFDVTNLGNIVLRMAGGSNKYWLGDETKAAVVYMDGNASESALGDFFNQGNSNYIFINDAAETAQFKIAGASAASVGQVLSLANTSDGEVAWSNAASLLAIPDTQVVYGTGTGVNSSSNLIYDVANDTFSVSTISGTIRLDSSQLQINDDTIILFDEAGTNEMALFQYFNGVYVWLGDLSALGNSLIFKLEDADNRVLIQSGGHDYLSLDIANATYAIGDISGAGSSTYMIIEDSASAVEFFVGGDIYFNMAKTGFVTEGVFIGYNGARARFYVLQDIIQLGDYNYTSHTYTLSIGSDGIDGTVRPSTNSTVVPIFNVIRDTSNGGGAAVGAGCSIDFSGKVVDGTPIIGNRLISQMTNVGDGTEAAKFIIQGLTGGSIADLFVLSGAGALRLNAYGAGAATFDASGNITSVSDPRLKADIMPYQVGIEQLMQITPITYKWNELSGYETEHRYAGFNAEEIFQVLGELGSGIDEREYRTLQDRAIIGLLVNSVKQQQKEMENMKVEMKKMKAA